MEDLQYTRSLGIYSLPAYLIQCGDKAILAKQLLDYDGFISVIQQLQNLKNP